MLDPPRYSLDAVLIRTAEFTAKKFCHFILRFVHLFKMDLWPRILWFLRIYNFLVIQPTREKTSQKQIYFYLCQPKPITTDHDVMSRFGWEDKCIAQLIHKSMTKYRGQWWGWRTCRHPRADHVESSSYILLSASLLFLWCIWLRMLHLVGVRFGSSTCKCRLDRVSLGW